jgi:hypothetical protein
MKKPFLIFSIILLPFVLQAQTRQIKKQDVAGIIRTLSSNKMKGRKAFSPQIRKAAKFISGKFKEAGLKPLKGQSGYLQQFPMYSISVASAQIKVNGAKITGKNYFAIVNGQDINWTQDDDVSVGQIKKGDDFRSAMRQYFRSKENVVVFVDPSFAKSFHRIQPYFSRSRPVFKKDKGSNKVFILASKANHFHILLQKDMKKKELANVVGKIEGKRKDQKVVFSAHYDHLGIIQPVHGDSIANGANDDASGTAAVIELAKYFSQKKQPERTLIFVTFTAEEEGGYGSKYFSEHVEPDQIVAMFNIEMIGKPSKKGPNSAWITGFDKSTFGKILQKNTKGMDFTFYPDPYPKQHLFYRSDNATLARLGVPAHSISTTQIDIDPDYHQVTDEISTLDLSSLTNTIRAIAKASEGIISGQDTPTRVDPTKVH